MTRAIQSAEKIDRARPQTPTRDGAIGRKSRGPGKDDSQICVLPFANITRDDEKEISVTELAERYLTD